MCLSTSSLLSFMDTAYRRQTDEAKGCPCWRDEQVDPECTIHGKPEFRAAPVPGLPTDKEKQ